MDSLEADVRVNSGDLYDYMLYHAYHGAQGLLGSCIGALAILIFLSNHQWIYLIAGVIMLVYLPWTLFLKSKQQALNTPAFQDALHYTFDEQGISVSQGETTESMAWKDIYKAVSTNRSIIIYTTRINACIFPRRELKEQEADVIQYICTHLEPKKVKIRN